MEKEKSKENKQTKEIKQDKKIEDKVELTKEEIEAMNKKMSEAEEKALRMQAELVNYRKRKDEETEKRLKYANEDLILEILPVIDNFERAIKMADNNPEDDKFLNGVKMIKESLINALKKFGVEEIEALGKTFDPSCHNAVMTESNEEKENDIILEVYQKGYILKDKIIRPSMVKVNKI